MNYFSTTPSNQTEIFNMDQHGQAFYRIGPAEEQGSYFDLEGEKMEIGKEVTVKYDLYKMVNYVLIRKLQNKSETIQVGGQSVANPWYNVSVDRSHAEFLPGRLGKHGKLGLYVFDELTYL